MEQTKPKRNPYISYAKGWAIICIMLIHLIDWSNITLTVTQMKWRELLYPSVMFFMAMAGAVVAVAYKRYDDLTHPTKRLFARGLQLIGLYYLYNLVKLVVFNFQTEPFYQQAIDKHLFDWYHILILRSFSVPLTIIYTIGLFLLLSPLLLWLSKRNKYSNQIILALAIALFIFNYFVPLPTNNLTDWLYGRNFVLFAPLSWLVPYLVGFYFGNNGLDRHILPKIGLFTAAAAASFYLIPSFHAAWQFSQNEFPLTPYYIFASFAFLYVVIGMFKLAELITWQPWRYVLALFQVLGDFSLSIYIVHWIIIDLTISWWNYKKIWITVPIGLTLLLIARYRRIQKLVEENRPV